MKILNIIALVVVAVSATSDHEEWISFKNEHGKMYKSLREELSRFKIFQDNLRKIEAHNTKYERGEETYMMGVNQFTDLTQYEFEQQLFSPDLPRDYPEVTFFAKSDIPITDTVDWREKGAVLPVQDQLKCGACWAFSTIGSIEGQNAIKHNKKIPVSAQELVDCISTYGTNGCRGGLVFEGLQYVRDHGISASKDYAYEHHKEKCRNATTPRLDFKVTGYTCIDLNEEALRQAVEKIGPISINLNATLLSGYKSGIFNPPDCREYFNHSITVVGYGTENGTEYWIMKNSWGEHWGEKGYFRMIRNKNNICGIANHAFYPNMV